MIIGVLSDAYFIYLSICLGGSARPAHGSPRVVRAGQRHRGRRQAHGRAHGQALRVHEHR